MNDWKEFEGIDSSKDDQCYIWCKCGENNLSINSKPKKCRCGILYKTDYKILMLEPEKENNEKKTS